MRLSFINKLLYRDIIQHFKKLGIEVRDIDSFRKHGKKYYKVETDNFIFTITDNKIIDVESVDHIPLDSKKLISHALVLQKKMLITENFLKHFLLNENAYQTYKYVDTNKFLNDLVKKLISLCKFYIEYFDFEEIVWENEHPYLKLKKQNNKIKQVIDEDTIKAALLKLLQEV